MVTAREKQALLSHFDQETVRLLERELAAGDAAENFLKAVAKELPLADRVEFLRAVSFSPRHPLAKDMNKHLTAAAKRLLEK